MPARAGDAQASITPPSPPPAPQAGR